MIIYSTIDMLTSFWVWLEPASAQVPNGVNDDENHQMDGATLISDKFKHSQVGFCPKTWTFIMDQNITIDFTIQKF